MDMIITLGVIGVFAFLLIKKHKQKKQTDNEPSEIVQTSELSNLPLFMGNTPFVQYPKGAQLTVRTFNTYKKHDKDFFVPFHVELESYISEEIADAERKGRAVSFQFIPVGTTLVLISTYTLEF